MPHSNLLTATDRHIEKIASNYVEKSLITNPEDTAVNESNARLQDLTTSMQSIDSSVQVVEKIEVKEPPVRKDMATMFNNAI
jgi:hypothetical protein